MKYILDTEAGTCKPYTEKEDAKTSSISKTEKMVRMLSEHRGDTEYNGFVETIQKWYYGSLVKASWCATTISYLLNQVGVAIKAENVKKLLDAVTESGRFEILDPSENVKRGDILFWLWSGNIMTESSSKHVGLAEYDSANRNIYCLGGNQKDKICTLSYDRKCLYKIARLKEV